MRTLLAVVLTFLAFTIAEAGRYTFQANFQRVTVQSGTYVASQVDTIIITREATLADLTLSIAPNDSMLLGGTTAGKIGRWFENALLTYIAADTLTNFTNYRLPVASVADTCIAGNVVISSTTQPLPDKYIVLITYAATGQGTYVGTTATTPTVYYTVTKRFYR